MTPLRQPMLDDLTFRDLAKNTKKSHLNSVARLAVHYRHGTKQISLQEVWAYLLFLHEERGLSGQTCTVPTKGFASSIASRSAGPSRTPFFLPPDAFQFRAGVRTGPIPVGM